MYTFLFLCLTLLFGILHAVDPESNPNNRVLAAVYLVAASLHMRLDETKS